MLISYSLCIMYDETFKFDCYDSEIVRYEFEVNAPNTLSIFNCSSDNIVTVNM